MKDLSEFADVLSQDIQIEEISASEFEFDDGLWCLRRERNHWEIYFCDEEGEQGMIIEREDFIDGKFRFGIDGESMNSFLRILIGLINSIMKIA